MYHSITHHDKFNIHDVINKKQQVSPFLGLVRIFENGKLNTDQSPDGWLTNMTIAKGREFAALKLFNKTKTISSSIVRGISSPYTLDFSTFSIDSFGIGSGGTHFETNNTIHLNGPSVCDHDLYTPIAINTNALTNSDGVSYVVKQIENPNDIEVIISNSTEYNDCKAYYTVVKCICTVTALEPTYLTAGQTVKVDEAMLYSTSSDPSITDPTKRVVPFAHICFEPKYIEKESIFVIEWYVIF